jgi:hypothetical protein
METVFIRSDGEEDKFKVVDDFKIYEREKLYDPTEEKFFDRIKRKSILTRKDNYEKYIIKYKTILN